jgi:hypothetical protein
MLVYILGPLQLSRFLMKDCFQLLLFLFRSSYDAYNFCFKTASIKMLTNYANFPKSSVPIGSKDLESRVVQS